MILFSFGIIFNILVRIILNKTKSGGLAILFGLIKLATFSPISAIALFSSRSALKQERESAELSFSYLEPRPIENGNINQRKERSNKTFTRNHFSPSRKYDIPQKSCISYGMVVFTILFIVYLALMFIGAGQAMKEGKIDQNQIILFFAGSIVIGLIILFILYKILYVHKKETIKKKRFLRFVEFAQRGMSVDEIKYIMREYSPSESGYDRHNDYVLIYKIELFGRVGDYERVTFIFKDDELIEKAMDYKRTTYR